MARRGQCRVVAADEETRRARSDCHGGRVFAAEQGACCLFYRRPQRMSFWMRNTLIELTCLFLDGFGVSRHIHHARSRLDETPISGRDDLLLVVAWKSKRCGLQAGLGYPGRRRACAPIRLFQPRTRGITDRQKIDRARCKIFGF